MAFQDAKRTGDGLIYSLCKGWYRHRGLLRGALRAMRDSETAVAHLAPHCPRRSALMNDSTVTIDDAASGDDATVPNKSTVFH